MSPFLRAQNFWQIFCRKTCVSVRACARSKQTQARIKWQKETFNLESFSVLQNLAKFFFLFFCLYFFFLLFFTEDQFFIFSTPHSNQRLLDGKKYPHLKELTLLLGTIHILRKHIFRIFDPPSKVIDTKYSKHWPYTVAHTIDCVCRKC